ncbi:hypothetical protein [uncultured Roseobacter sp.]|uniref:hypothetical protein n=1 Tax=uncultured Roseobacter sp. TaxID=114847 RepID=UPI002635172E|nr:hypothetical protein [uncultured Roseobacter sp.]
MTLLSQSFVAKNADRQIADIQTRSAAMDRYIALGIALTGQLRPKEKGSTTVIRCAQQNRAGPGDAIPKLSQDGYETAHRIGANGSERRQFGKKDHELIHSSRDQIFHRKIKRQRSAIRRASPEVDARLSFREDQQRPLRQWQLRNQGCHRLQNDRPQGQKTCAYSGTTETTGERPSKAFPPPRHKSRFSSSRARI